MKIVRLIIFLLLIAMVIDAKMYSDKVHAAQQEATRLEGIGYSSDWAHHKAFVEAGLLPADSLYWAIEQD